MPITLKDLCKSEVLVRRARSHAATIEGKLKEALAAHGREFDVIHASPPCQRYTPLAKMWNARRHEDSVLESIKRERGYARARSRTKRPTACRPTISASASGSTLRCARARRRGEIIIDESVA